MSPLGDHTTRQDDKGDQPSGGHDLDKYWMNTILQRENCARHVNLEAHDDDDDNDDYDDGMMMRFAFKQHHFTVLCTAMLLETVSYFKEPTVRETGASSPTGHVRHLAFTSLQFFFW